MLIVCIDPTSIKSWDGNGMLGSVTVVCVAAASRRTVRQEWKISSNQPGPLKQRALARHNTHYSGVGKFWIWATAA